MNLIRRLILKSLLKEPVPDSIPRTGEKAEKINCYVVYFRSKDETWTLLCEKVSDKGVTGKYWLDKKDLGRKFISFDSMDEYTLDITHFFATYDLRYNSITQYFFEGIIPVDKVKILFGNVQQFLFNKKELVRSERIEVLKSILKETLEDRVYEVTSVSLLTLLYTQKWVFHPDKTRQLNYNELLLNSLVESKDLEKTKYGCKLSPRALVTISQYEEDQKKHRENLAQTRAMKWLTLALIIVGLTQAGVAYYAMSHSDVDTEKSNYISYIRVDKDIKDVVVVEDVKAVNVRVKAP